MMNYITVHSIEIVVLFLLILFIGGEIAWVTNGLGLTKFDLDYTWKGIGTLFGAGVFSSLKYVADSCKNSEQGKMPFVENLLKGDKNV